MKTTTLTPIADAIDAYEAALTTSIFDEQDADAEQLKELAAIRLLISNARAQLGHFEALARAACKAGWTNPNTKAGIEAHSALGKALVGLNGAPTAYRGYLNPTGEPLPSPTEIAAALQITADPTS